MRLIDADALIADCQLAQKQADRHGREFANAVYSGGGEISTEWWCVEDMIENAPTIEPDRKNGYRDGYKRGKRAGYKKARDAGRKKGKWINHRNDNGHNIADCNICGNPIQWFDDDEKPRFCCMCGADNRGEECGKNN